MNSRTWMLTLAASVAWSGLLARSATLRARPIPDHLGADNPRLRLPFDRPPIDATGGARCESTGFEPVEATCGWETGFMCGGGFVGICFNPGPECTGDNSTDQNCCIDNRNPLNGWYMSNSSAHCNEPHIDTINPATGTQHMRFDRDPLGGNPPGTTGFGVSARISAFTPAEVGPLLLGRSVIDFDIALGDPTPGESPFGSSVVFWTVADNEAGSSGIAVQVSFDAQGVVFYNDIAAGGYQGLGFLTGNASYDHLNIDVDPCHNLVTYTMTDPGGASVSRLTDFTGLEKTTERAIFLNDNAGFFWDVDNYSVVRIGVGCPPQCENNGVQTFAGEECDGDADQACPDRCIEPGYPGQCTCVRPCKFCSDDGSCEASIGRNGPFLTHGGFFTYTPDTNFVAIDTCGSDFDTALFVGGEGFCDGGAFIANDDCVDSGDCTDGGGQHGPETCAPMASCYDNVTEGESCLCVPTVPGAPVTLWAAEFPGKTPDAGTHLIVNITRALSCGAEGQAIPNGACCNGLDGSCTDNVPVEDCSRPSDTWTDNNLCSLVQCSKDTGGCCDAGVGLGGQCTPGAFPEDCTGALQTYHKLDDTCGGSCEEVTGACCDGLTGVCYESTDRSCTATPTHRTWTLGATCAQASCDSAIGACCDTGTSDPTVSSCTVTARNACECTKCAWTKGVACADIECIPNYQVIPTVSRWGMAVLTILLLIAGKIYFARRESAPA